MFHRLDVYKKAKASAGNNSWYRCKAVVPVAAWNATAASTDLCPRKSIRERLVRTAVLSTFAKRLDRSDFHSAFPGFARVWGARG